MRDTSVLLILFLSVLSIACAQRAQPRKTVRLSTKQGICGTVIVKSGNHMPSPDAVTPTGRPAEREVLIFALLNASQVDAGDNGFIRSVREARPVKTVRSGKDGTFCVDLPVGRYSVIIRESKGLYANLSDSQNNINPVTVARNRQTQLTVEITHEAVF